MVTKRILRPALSIVLISVISCDKGGPKQPVQPEFQGVVEGVVAAEETSLSGVTVQLTGGVVRTSQTSATGQFSFPGLPAGTYVVAIDEFPEDVEFSVTSKAATIHEGKGSARVDFAGSRKRDGKIRGSVDVEGVPLEGANVSVSGPESRSSDTDPEGAFEFTQLQRGTYVVSLSGFDEDLYSFTVTEQTVEARNASVVEADFSGAVIPQPPLSPTDLSGIATGSSTIALSWIDASDDETRFEVHRRTGAENPWSQIAALDPNTTTFDDLGLRPATSYGFKVRACNEVGCSDFSNETIITTEDVPPEPPIDLNATASGPYSIDLLWTDASANETRFEVEQRVGQDSEWTRIGTLDADVSGFSASQLDPNTAYWYRVRACNDVGCSAYSAAADATTHEVPPEAPSSLTASATGSTTVHIGWSDGSGNEDRFEVERRTGAVGQWAFIGATGADQAEFGDTGLTPNTSYAYRVRACNEVGCSEYTDEAGAVTEEVAPDSPTQLQATATGSATVALSWNDGSSNEATFEVERRRGSFSAWTGIASLGVNANSFEDGGLSPNTTYFYRVRACNDVGCSSFSNSADARTDDIPPETPAGLAASATGPSGIRLTWTDESSNETQFRVEKKTGTGGAWAQVGTAPANAETYQSIGLDPSTTYFFRVRACNAVGCSLFSGEANATTEAAPPDAPSGLTATATGPTSVDLSWVDESDDETLFRVERREGVAGVYSEIGTLPENSDSFSDSSLLPNTAYYYRATACNAGGCSSPSNEAVATTENVSPGAPAGLVATATGSSTASLEWTDMSSNETGFRVERKEGAAGVFGEAGSVAANTNTYSDTGLSANTTYYYRVVAFNGVGESAPSDEANTTTWAGGGPNLSISNLYITQSTQNLSGDVPLVADRDGFLRVFAVASEANSFQPSVRVEFFLGGSLVHTENLTAPSSSVPTSVDESSLTASWNIDVPGSLIQPGLSVLASVDPTDQVAEGNEGDNLFPADGAPLTMDVRSTSPFNVTFVPVRQSVNNLLGNVTTGNAAQYMDVTLRMLPISEANIVVHAEYVTDALELESGNDNGAWSTILSEVLALRSAEGSSRYYYGVVKTTYNSGVAGMGYLGWPAAIGWDRLPSGSGVAAHEWGHNWNRYHAPGCGAGNPDASYPYAEGKIGVWGMDVAVEALKSPITHYDFMSYCSTDWISDYNYKAIMDYRQAHGAVASGGQPEPSLLVWGRIEEGEIIVEPAFEVTTIPKLPAGGGEYRLEGLTQTGGPLFAMDFQPVSVPDAGGGDGHFAFAIPLRSIDRNHLASLRVSGGGRAPASMHRRLRPGMAAAPEVGLSPVAGTVVNLTWDAASFPMAMVRDPVSGEILSFARGGQISLPISGNEVEVVLSDGLGSSERVVRRSVR